MSFSLSNISGSQIQKDSFVNSLTVACDPGLVAPKTNSLTGLPNSLNLEKRDGKAAIGVDICDLDVSNLTVHGNLVVNGVAEICDIVCPVDFSVTAGNKISTNSTAGTTISAGGASATSAGGIILTTTATTTPGTNHVGDINLVPVSGDINFGNYAGNTNTVSPHLVVYGGESAAPTAAAGPASSATWTAATFLTESSGITTRSGSTDTAGNVFVTGLPTTPTTATVITAGDSIRLTFNRAYPTPYIHSLWQGMAAEAFGNNTDAAAAGVVLALSPYYTTTQTGPGAPDVTLTFLRDVTVTQITGVLTPLGLTYTGNLSFGYFNIDSAALE